MKKSGGICSQGARMVLIAFALLSPLREAASEGGFDTRLNGLCFENHDPSTSEAGVPLLSWLGEKNGICQGMSAIVAAAWEHIEFRPELRPRSQHEGRTQLQEALRRYYLGTRSVQKIVVRGHRNLMEWCQTDRREFIAQSTRANAWIAVAKIAERLPSFLSYRREVLTSKKSRAMLAKELQSLESLFDSGRRPLMLSYSHVRTVVSIQKKGSTRVFWLYDSNDNLVHSETYSIGSDGLLLPGHYRMRWNITP